MALLCRLEGRISRSRVECISLKPHSTLMIAQQNKLKKTKTCAEFWPRMQKRWGKSLLASLSLIFLCCCATFPKEEWNASIGQLSYDQAVTDMGPPAAQAELSDGSRVAEWLLRKGRDRFFMVDTSPGFGVQNVTEMGSPDFYLRLIFDPQGVLKSWRRVTKN